MKTPKEKSKSQDHETVSTPEKSVRISLLEEVETTASSTPSNNVNNRKRKKTETESFAGDACKEVALEALSICTDATKDREFVFERSMAEMKNITIGVNDIDICLLLHAQKDNVTHASDCFPGETSISFLKKKRKISLEIEDNCVHISHDFPKVQVTPLDDQSSGSELQSVDKMLQTKIVQSNTLLQSSSMYTKISRRLKKNCIHFTESNGLSFSDDHQTIDDNSLDSTVNTVLSEEEEKRPQKKKKKKDTDPNVFKLYEKQCNTLNASISEVNDDGEETNTGNDLNEITTLMVQELLNDKIVTSTPYFSNQMERKKNKIKSHINDSYVLQISNFQCSPNIPESPKQRKNGQVAIIHDAPVGASLQTSDYNSLTEHSEASEIVDTEKKKKKKKKDKNQEYVTSTCVDSEFAYAEPKRKGSNNISATEEEDVAMSAFLPVKNSGLSHCSAIHDKDDQKHKNKKRNKTFQNNSDSLNSHNSKEMHENELNVLSSQNDEYGTYCSVVDENRTEEENICHRGKSKQKKKKVLTVEVNSYSSKEKYENELTIVAGQNDASRIDYSGTDNNRSQEENTCPEGTVKQKKKNNTILECDLNSHISKENHENELSMLADQNDEIGIDDTMTQENICHENSTKEKKNNVPADAVNSHSSNEKYENDVTLLASQNVELDFSGIDDNRTGGKNNFEVCHESSTKQKKNKKGNVIADDTNPHSSKNETENYCSEMYNNRTPEENSSDFCSESTIKQKRKKKRKDLDSHSSKEKHENELSMLAVQNVESETICSEIDDSRTQYENTCHESTKKQKKKKRNVIADDVNSDSSKEKRENELSMLASPSQIDDTRSQEENICHQTTAKQKKKKKGNEVQDYANPHSSKNENDCSEMYNNKTPEENSSDVCPDSTPKQKRKKKNKDVDSHSSEKKYENELSALDSQIVDSETICSGTNRTGEENTYGEDIIKQNKKKGNVVADDMNPHSSKNENETDCSEMYNNKTPEENSSEVCPDSTTKQKRKKKKRDVVADDVNSHSSKERRENELSMLASQNDESETFCSRIVDNRIGEENISHQTTRKQMKNKNVIADDLNSDSSKEKHENERSMLASQNDEIGIDDTRSQEESICHGSSTKRKKKKKKDVLADDVNSHSSKERSENELILASQNDESKTICSGIDDTKIGEENILHGDTTKQKKKKKNVIADDINSHSSKSETDCSEMYNNKTLEENSSDICPDSTIKQKRKKKKKNVLADYSNSHCSKEKRENELSMLASQIDESETICSGIHDTRTEEENIFHDTMKQKKKKKNVIADDMNSHSSKERHKNEFSALASQIDEIGIDDNNFDVFPEGTQQKVKKLADDVNSLSVLDVEIGEASSHCEKKEKRSKKKKNTNDSVTEDRQHFDDNCDTSKSKTKKRKITDMDETIIHHCDNSFSTVSCEKSDTEQEENRSVSRFPACAEISLLNQDFMNALYCSDVEEDADLERRKKKKQHKTREINPEENIALNSPNISEASSKNHTSRRNGSKTTENAENISDLNSTDCSEIGADDRHKTGKNITKTNSCDDFVFAKPKEKKKKKITNIDTNTISLFRNGCDDQILSDKVKVRDNGHQNNNNDDTDMQNFQPPGHSDSSGDADAGHSDAWKNHDQGTPSGRELHQKKRKHKVAMADSSDATSDVSPQVTQGNHTERSTSENDCLPMNQNDESIILDSQVGDGKEANVQSAIKQNSVKLKTKKCKSKPIGVDNFADIFKSDRLEFSSDPSHRIAITTTESNSSRVENVRKQLNFSVDNFYSPLSQTELIKRPLTSAKFQAASSQEQNLNNTSVSSNRVEHLKSKKVAEWLRNNMFISDEISEDATSTRNNSNELQSQEENSNEENKGEEVDSEPSSIIDSLVKKALNSTRRTQQNKSDLLNKSKSSTSKRKKLNPETDIYQHENTKKAVKEQSLQRPKKTEKSMPRVDSVPSKQKQCFEFPSQTAGQSSDVSAVSPCKSIDVSTCDGRLASFYKMIPKSSTLKSSSVSVTSFNSTAISLRLQNTSWDQSAVHDGNLEVTRSSGKSKHIAAKERDLNSTHRSVLSRSVDDSKTKRVEAWDKMIEAAEERLKNLNIVENFAVHEEHDADTLSQNENCKNAAKEFLVYEDAIIRNNWKQFCKLYNFKENEYFYFTQVQRTSMITSTQHLLFAKFLGQKLPQRSLMSIMERFSKLMTITTSISKKEVDFLIKSRNGRNVLPFSKIAKCLDRSLGCVKSYYYRHKLYEIEWSSNDDTSETSSRPVSPNLEDSTSMSSQIASPREKWKSISKDLSNTTAASSKNEKVWMEESDDDMDDSEIGIDRVKVKVSKAAKTTVSDENHASAKLRNLSIYQNFEVIEGHRIETTLFHNTSEEVMHALSELGMNTGKRFSPFEDDIIRNNWEKFCKLYNFHKEEDHAFFTTGTVHGQTYIDPNELIKFARFLGQGLPKRSLRSIITRFSSKLNPSVKFTGRFYADDDKFILEHRDGTKLLKFKTIASKLARSVSSVKHRYYRLKEYDFVTKGNLRKYFEDKDLLSGQIKLIMKSCGFTSIDDLREKTRDLNYPIPWPEINRLNPGEDRISYVLWSKYLHTALHITQIYDTIDVTLSMIQILKESPEICCKEEIEWRDMAQHFPGFHSVHLSLIFLSFWHTHAKKFLRANTSWQDALELFEEILPKHSFPSKIYPLEVAQDGTVLELPFE